MTHPSAVMRESCTHHWIIETANGRWSPGKCCHCGEVKEFKNVVDEAIHDPSRPRLGNREVY